MLVEPSANHFTVFRPFVIRVEGSMNADKALAIVLDERHHIGLLAVVEVKFACCAYKNEGIEVIESLRVSSQVLLRDQFDIGAKRGIPEEIGRASCTGR